MTSSDIFFYKPSRTGIKRMPVTGQPVQQQAYQKSPWPQPSKHHQQICVPSTLTPLFHTKAKPMREIPRIPHRDHGVVNKPK